MARRKRRLEVEEDEPNLDISSLIDVCFLLLIYFLLTSTIEPPEKDLPMTIPSSEPSSDEKPDIEPMLITVLPSGEVTVNKTEPMDAGAVGRERVLPNLSARLNEYSSMAQSAGEQPLIQIFASPECPQQKVIDVLNAIRGANINTLTFTDIED